MDEYQLTESQKQVASLFAFDGLKQSEIADRLQISQQAVSLHLIAARKKLGAHANRIKRPRASRRLRLQSLIAGH